MYALDIEIIISYKERFGQCGELCKSFAAFLTKQAQYMP
jgi:hypothetical protein